MDVVLKQYVVGVTAPAEWSFLQPVGVGLIRLLCQFQS